MKQPELVSLELGIRALAHERLTRAWRSGSSDTWNIGFEAGLDCAIKILENLNVANQQLKKDPRP